MIFARMIPTSPVCGALLGAGLMLALAGEPYAAPAAQKGDTKAAKSVPEKSAAAKPAKAAKGEAAQGEAKGATKTSARRFLLKAKAHPLRIPNSQIEPLAWHQIAGWTDDDHAAAFATFLVSCRPILRGGSPKAKLKARAQRSETLSALNDICKRAVAAVPLDAAGARAFFEQNFRAVKISALGEPQAFYTGYYEPVVDGRAAAKRSVHGPALQSSRQPDHPAFAAVRQERRRRQARGQTQCAVLRPHPDRGRRTGRPRAGNLLPEKSDRRLLRRDPGLHPRPAGGRQDAAAQLRRRQRSSLYGGRQIPDRARHRLERRDVDAEDSRIHGGQSGRRAQAAAREQVICVLPRDRPFGIRRGDRRARRVVDRRPLARGGSPDPHLWHAVFRGHAIFRSRQKSPIRISAAS